jgi:hypothetical protein
MDGTTKDPPYNTGDCLRDALRFVADASFAILPRDAAHKLGEFEKNFWGGVRWCADRGIECVDDALAGGDRLREEWRRSRPARPSPAAGPAEGPAGGI